MRRKVPGTLGALASYLSEAWLAGLWLLALLVLLGIVPTEGVDG